jgi:uncharacterized protein YycO
VIRVSFLGGDDMVSRGIRLHCYGFWATHVDAVMPDGRKIGAIGDGVKARPADYDERTEQRLLLELDCDQATADRFHTFLREQIGKPYDFTAIAAFVARRDWQRPDSWFCSELIAAALLECGFLRHTLAATANKITPRDLLLILSCRPDAGVVNATGDFAS